MPENLASILNDALRLPKDAVVHTIFRALTAAFPDRYVLRTDDSDFNVHQFARDGHCVCGPWREFVSEYDQRYYANSIPWIEPRNVWETIEWESHRLDLLTVTQTADSCGQTTSLLIAPTEEIAQAFFMAVCRWNSEIRGEVLVYNGGWYKDEALFQSIQGSTLDNLVLEPGLKERIRDDFNSFFRARETYERYRIPWKRGVLLLGPPGNGKTHCIKALVNLLEVPCLYVRTFKSRYETDFAAMRNVFSRARGTAPCLMVFEDLDSILTNENRSFFLNELDGFAANTGLMIVATTNHPERLDPAILDRPSRFDRKYTFRLPDEERRAEYLATFGAALEPALRLDPAAAREMALRTDEFSYAYLKELYLSSMMAWISADGSRPFACVMEDQVEPLRTQMKTVVEEPPPPRDEDWDD